MITAPFNLIAAFAFAFPASWIGRLIELPLETHLFYGLLCGGLVGMFGLAYLWLAGQPDLNKPVLFLGVCGKAMAVLIGGGLFLADSLSGLTAALLSGDLLFAALWFYWLHTEKRREDDHADKSSGSGDARWRADHHCRSGR